jgi:hypothetical protein
MVRTEPSATAQEPLWPQTPRSGPVEWERLERYAEYLAAEIVAGLLESEGVPAFVESMTPFPGMSSYASVWVPEALAHRARWILAWPPPSEAELTFLATGELPSGEQR